MDTNDLQDECAWFSDSDSDDSIVVTLSQMQDEAAKLQSSAAEIREKLSGLLTELDDIGQLAIKDRNRKRNDSTEPLDICADEEESRNENGASAYTLNPVDEGEEASDSDDRYHDVNTSWPEDCRVTSSGDSAELEDATTKPYDPNELLETIIDAVMERQSGAGDSVEAHPQKPPCDKQDLRGSQKSSAVTEGPGVAGDVDGNLGAGGSDSDDADVVTSPAAAVGDCSRRRRRTRKPTSDGDQSSDGRSSSTLEDSCLDTEVVDALGLVDGPEHVAYRFE